MKFWFLAIGVIAVAGWIMVRPMTHTVLPAMLRAGNEQILASWRDALVAYKKEFGTFPPTDLCDTREESILNALNKQNPKELQFLDLPAIRLNLIVPVDAWGQALIFDYERNGDLSYIMSAGQDGKFQTEDDMNSRDARQRNIPIPEDILDERTRSRRAAQAEAAKQEAEKATAEGTANPDKKDAVEGGDVPKSAPKAESVPGSADKPQPPAPAK